MSLEQYLPKTLTISQVVKSTPPVPASRSHTKRESARPVPKSVAPDAEEAVQPARYQQIKDFVIKNIDDGVWKPGDRVPTELDMVEQFQISRMTVNRALRELAEQGRIVRMAGVGTFVAEDRPQSTLLQIANVADEIRQRGHTYRRRKISVTRESASMEVAAALDLRIGASVFHAVFVHYENDLAIQLEDRYVAPSVCPDFINQDFEDVTASEYLLKTVEFDEVEHVVDAIQPNATQIELLEITNSEPCLVLTRRTWREKVPVTWVKCIHPGTRYRLGSRFKAELGGSMARPA